MVYIREERNEKTGDKTKADRASDKEIARRPKSGRLNGNKIIEQSSFLQIARFGIDLTLCSESQ